MNDYGLDVSGKSLMKDTSVKHARDQHVIAHMENIVVITKMVSSKFVYAKLFFPCLGKWDCLINSRNPYFGKITGASLEGVCPYFYICVRTIYKRRGKLSLKDKETLRMYRKRAQIKRLKI